MRRTLTYASLAAMLIMAATAMITACSSAAPAPQAAASSVRTPPATGPASAAPSGPAQQALAAYIAMWADVQALSETSNYTDPRLGDHLDGQAYTNIAENMSVEKADGIIALGAPVLHPSVVTATAKAVTLRDCLDDTHWLTVYAATHKPSDNVPGGHRYVAATVTNENGTWKVTVLDTRGEGTCT